MKLRTLDQLLNTGVTPETSQEIKRQYRQVNGFCLFFMFIVISALFFLIIMQYPLFTILLQLGFFSMYIIVFFFTSRHKLKSAQRFMLYMLEFHTFFLTMLLVGKQENGSYYSIFLHGLYVYPLLAVLVEEPIIPHLMIALIQMAAFLISAPLLAPYYEQLIPSHTLYGSYLTILDMFMLFFEPIVAAGIVSIIHRENIRSRKEAQQEIDRRLQAVQMQEQAEQALQTKVQELERTNKLMIDRELKMIELKKQLSQQSPA